jgi:hypothetical protein
MGKETKHFLIFELAPRFYSAERFEDQPRGLLSVISPFSHDLTLSSSDGC